MTNCQLTSLEVKELSKVWCYKHRLFWGLVHFYKYSHEWYSRTCAVQLKWILHWSFDCGVGGISGFRCVGNSFSFSVTFVNCCLENIHLQPDSFLLEDNLQLLKCSRIFPHPVSLLESNLGFSREKPLRDVEICYTLSWSFSLTYRMGICCWQSIENNIQNIQSNYAFIRAVEESCNVNCLWKSIIS